jgi:hypothetical protein
MESTPSKGSTIKGSKAVPAIGTASVIHQIAIHRVKPNINFPSGAKPGASTKKKSKANARGPAKRPSVGNQLFIGEEIRSEDRNRKKESYGRFIGFVLW